MNEEDNPYGVLGLGLGGADVTEVEIKKARPRDRAPRLGLTPAQAYRRRAIEVHPDKRPPAERERALPSYSSLARLMPSGAESEFNALAKAYELLWRVARSPRARADAPQRRRGARGLGRLGRGSQREAGARPQLGRAAQEDEARCVARARAALR